MRAPIGWRISDAPGVPPSPRSRGEGWGEGHLLRSPVKGIGKPEPLRGDLVGWWSRRITGDHRTVYRIRGAGEEQRVEIIACRHHYSARR
ncbi:MAG TPA: Txe/YoeB family addiction module toxin [Stellaceae bacterium]|nr:Txe/YoeB family addiction module toxin [Stellaceae bacterium]